jgi:signal transduction histidine kinase
LIENFLIYAQIELVAADPKKIESLRHVERLPIRDIISSLAMDRAERAQRQEDLRIGSLDFAFSVSEEHIRKIVEELVDNAFKFSEKGTPITIEGSAKNGRIALIVTDQGRGMTPEQISSVGAHMQFERKFYEQQGAGLGLFIAKRLTELYGGQFAIESTPRQRTVVRLAFPANNPS